LHGWYAPSTAPKTLALRSGPGTEIVLNTFQVLQLLVWLKANEQEIRDQAKRLSDILVPHARKQTEAARRADAGIIDYSQYE
jgi:hypothetical protein